jgi:hypothetical protein
MTSPYSANSEKDLNLILGKGVSSVSVPNTNEGWAGVNELANEASRGRPHAGGTMNVNTFKVAKIGDPLVFVGGEEDSKGNKIETRFEDAGAEEPKISPLSILQHAQRIREATNGRPNANLGLWVAPRTERAWKRTDLKGIYVDASGGFGSNEKAIAEMKNRPAEQGAWSMIDQAKDPKKKNGYLPNPNYSEAKDPTSEKFEGK